MVSVYIRIHSKQLIMNQSAVEMNINRLLDADDTGRSCEYPLQRDSYCPYRDYFGLVRVVEDLTGHPGREEMPRPWKTSFSSEWDSSTPQPIGTPTEDASPFSPLLLENPFVYGELPRLNGAGRVATNCIASHCAEKFKVMIALGRAAQRQVCVFCRNNGESESVFATHSLKSTDGRVTCPVLRAYTCPICGASGDEAHTIKYCPRNREGGDRCLPRPHGRLRNATGRRK